MMQGVEILNATNDTLVGMGVIIVTVLLICISVASGAWLIITDDEDERRKTAIALFISVICTIVVFNINACTVYDVIIDETVDFNEFVEKYEIIETEGKIYKVIEREDSDVNDSAR